MVTGTKAVNCSDTGNNKINRLEENLKAVDVELTTENLQQTEAVTSNIQIEGEHYPEALEKMTGL